MLAQERRESFTTRALRSGQALILEYDNMTDPTRKSWMRRGVEGAVRSAFMKAYSTVKVNPEKNLHLLPIPPDLGILPAITLRMIQMLSLIYGFPYNTEEEEAELWVAAASAAGVDISRELLEKQFVAKFVPRVIQRIAVSASAEIVEKWTARLIPLVSSAIGAGLNHYFVKVWGERAMGHFRQKHLQMRSQQVNSTVRPPSLPAS